MTLSEIDGFLAGILLCPELIMPSDWLPHVWGVTKDASFPDLKTVEKTIGAVMAHYNTVASEITQSLWIEPIYESNPNSDEVLWEPWVDGFTRAVALRTDVWETFLVRANDESRSAFMFILRLQGIQTGNSEFKDEEIELIDVTAPDLIPTCLGTILSQSRPELSRREPANLADEPFKADPRLGRNDPCPCGSGRKYKQCCGRN
jgi:uncharacterized protein